MTPLVINSTEDTPEVIFDPTTGKFTITGTSIPENARKFYDQILAWNDEYLKDPNADTSVSFKLKYFNTASTKYLFDMMVQIAEYSKRTIEQRKELPGLQPKRADVILAGACILKVITDRLGCDGLTISDRGLRHGLAFDLFQK